MKKTSYVKYLSFYVLPPVWCHQMAENRFLQFTLKEYSRLIEYEDFLHTADFSDIILSFQKFWLSILSMVV